MAIQDKDGFWRGKKGDSIYRRLNNQNVISQATKKRRQTVSSQAAACGFGFASNTARAIRLALGPFYIGLDGGLVNRLNVAVLQALAHSPAAEPEKRDLHDADLSSLSGLQFNAHAPLNKIMKLRPQITVQDDDTLRVTLPALSGEKDLSYPRSAFHIACCLRVTQYAFDFRREFYINMGFREAEIKPLEFQGIDWHFDECLPPGSIGLACMSLHYYIQGARGETKELGIREFSPAELIAAYHVAGQQGQHEGEWQDHYLQLNGYRGNETIRNNDASWPW